MVTVVGHSAPSIIPSYAVDGDGNRIERMPMYNISNNKGLEAEISWSPQSIVTSKPIKFILSFFEMPENTKLHLWPYNFIIIQNGSQIYRSSGMAEVAASIQRYTFDSGGQQLQDRKRWKS